LGQRDHAVLPARMHIHAVNALDNCDYADSSLPWTTTAPRRLEISSSEREATAWSMRTKRIISQRSLTVCPIRRITRSPLEPSPEFLESLMYAECRQGDMIISQVHLLFPYTLFLIERRDYREFSASRRKCMAAVSRDGIKQLGEWR
jgi:hypothetical protein